MSDLDKLVAAIRPKCLNCMERDAKATRQKAAIFCTAACAVTWAHRTALESLVQWCPRHQLWHDEESREDCEKEQKLRLEDPRIPL